MLYCYEPITIIRCDGENYTTEVIRGASWADNTQIVTETGGVKYANNVRIRIPAAKVPGAIPAVGDQIVRGVLLAGTTITKRSDFAAYNPRRVMAVHDNRRGGLAHIALVCQ